MMKLIRSCLEGVVICSPLGEGQQLDPKLAEGGRRFLPAAAI